LLEKEIKIDKSEFLKSAKTLKIDQKIVGKPLFKGICQKYRPNTRGSG